MPEARKILVLMLACLFLCACAGPALKKTEKPRGVYHRVKKGETLSGIAKAYNTDILDLVVVNKITDPDAIDADSVIFIPGAGHVEEIRPHAEAPTVPAKQAVKPPALPPDRQPGKEPLKAGPVQSSQSARKAPPGDKRHMKAEEKPERMEADAGPSRFVWPLSGVVLVKFGVQSNGQRFNGIRIAAREGTPIKCSAEGEVILSSPIKYYGETIIIKHDGHYLTVYAFLKNKKVKVGDHVKKGQPIAHLGRPENSNGRPYLHFEIRHNNNPRNPLLFLPQPLDRKKSFS